MLLLRMLIVTPCPTNAGRPLRSASDHLAMAPCCPPTSASCCSSAVSARLPVKSVPGQTRREVAACRAPGLAWWHRVLHLR